MPHITTPPAPKIRHKLDDDQLKNFRRIIKIFGWRLIPFKELFSPEAHKNSAFTAFNLEWLHTFFEVHASLDEKREMLESGYEPRN